MTNFAKSIISIYGDKEISRLAFMAFLPLSFSYSDLPEAPDLTVPEFSSVTYTVSADSVRLRAELNRKPIGGFSCGFMLGTDTTDMQTVHSEIMDSPAFESTERFHDLLSHSLHKQWKE